MIEEKIRQWCAAATVEEAGERVVVVPDRDVAEVCRRLHDDAEEPMDFMRDLVAADGDGRLSVFYQLESTRTGERTRTGARILSCPRCAGYGRRRKSRNARHTISSAYASRGIPTCAASTCVRIGRVIRSARIMTWTATRSTWRMKKTPT